MLVDLDVHAPADTTHPLLSTSLYSVSRMNVASTEEFESPRTMPDSEEIRLQEGSDTASIAPRVANSNSDHPSSRPSGDQKSTSTHSRSTSQKHSRRLSTQKSFSSRPINVFRPRPYEEIYAERAYLGVCLQSHVNKLCDLISKYSLTEEESIHGETRKCKRAARKQLGILRGQLFHAAEQEKAIFVRLGELYVEAMSRETWDVARKQCPPRTKRTSQTQIEGEMRPRSKSNLNGATPEFIPRKDLSDHQEDNESVISSTQTSDDGEPSSSGNEMYNSELGKNRMEFLLAPNKKGDSRRRQRRMSGDGGGEVFKPARRLSLPNMGSARPPQNIAWSN